MRKGLLVAALLVLGSNSPAGAVEFSFDGYADLRAIFPSNQVGWLDGGLGKLRYGSEQSSPEFRIAEVVGQGVAQVTPGLMAMAVVAFLFCLAGELLERYLFFAAAPASKMPGGLS